MSNLKKPGIRDVQIFQLADHQTEVQQRQEDVQRLDRELDALASSRSSEVSSLKNLMWAGAKERKAELERLVAEVIKQELQRPEDIAQLNSAVEKAELELKLFMEKVLPGVQVLEAKEAKRQAQEEAERRSYADPLNWIHTGVWAHDMLLSEANVAQHQDRVWSYTETPVWTCCKATSEQAKGCKRIDK